MSILHTAIDALIPYPVYIWYHNKSRNCIGFDFSLVQGNVMAGNFEGLSCYEGTCGYNN